MYEKADTRPRGYGKTEALLRRAIDMARTGQPVCIITAHVPREVELRRQARSVAAAMGCEWVVRPDNYRGFDIKTVNNHSVKEDRPGEYRLVGQHDTVIVVDFYHLQERYGAVIEAWEAANDAAPA